MTNMLVHVFAWYSIIWSLTLAQGNPVNTQELSGNGTNVTGVVLTGEPINRCNARCSTKGKNAGHCFIRSLSYKPSLLKTKKSWEVPNPPADLKITFTDVAGALQISVTSGRKTYEPLGFILMELVSLAESDQFGAYEDTQYLFLENNSSKSQFVSFSFHCSEIQADIYEIRVNVWTIGPNKADINSDNQYVFDIGPYDPVTSKIFISKEYRQHMKEVNKCICDSKVQTIRLYQDTKAGTIQGSVNVTQFPRDGQLEILLLHTSDTGTVTEAGRWWRNGNGSYTVFKFTERNMTQGIYNVKVKRHCNHRYKIWTKCDQETPVDIVSKDLIVDKSDVSRIKHSGSPISSTLRTSKVRTLRDAYVVTEFAVIVVSSFASAMILIAAIIKLCNDVLSNRLRTDLGGHRESAEHLLPSASFTDKESDLRVKAIRAVEKRLKEDSIPLIYTEDSEEHRTMVYELRDKLEKCGVKILIVDDDNCPNVTLNWVDFAEKIAKSYRTYLFVVSPLLFKLCHEGKHGDENSFESLLEKTKGIHLPPILLRNFEALCARNCQKPRLCLVELSERHSDNVRVVDERTEAADGTSPPNNESTHIAQEQAKRDMRSSCPLSELKQEDTLSSNLIDDYTILSDAKCFRLSHEDLSDNMGSRQVTLSNLSNWLKG